MERPFPLGAVIQRYLAEEIPERPSTASRYRCWLRNHVEPKWRDYPIEQIKPLVVEDWLKKLNLAPKSKPHLKNLDHPEVAREYESLKRHLSSRYDAGLFASQQAYAEAKGSFIAAVTAQAVAQGYARTATTRSVY